MPPNTSGKKGRKPATRGPRLARFHPAYITAAVLSIVSTICAAVGAALPWVAVTADPLSLTFAPFLQCVQLGGVSQCGYVSFNVRDIVNASYWPFFGGFAAAISCLFSLFAFILALGAWCRVTGPVAFLLVALLFESTAAALGVYWWWDNYGQDAGVENGLNWGPGLFLVLIAVFLTLVASLSLGCGWCCVACHHCCCGDLDGDDARRDSEEDEDEERRKSRRAKLMPGGKQRGRGAGSSDDEDDADEESAGGRGASRGREPASTTTAASSSSSSSRRSRSRSGPRDPSGADADVADGYQARSNRAYGMAPKADSGAAAEEWGKGGKGSGSGGGGKRAGGFFGGLFGGGDKSSSSSPPKAASKPTSTTDDDGVRVTVRSPAAAAIAAGAASSGGGPSSSRGLANPAPGDSPAGAITDSAIISRGLAVISAAPGDVATEADMRILVPRVQAALEDVAAKRGRELSPEESALLTEEAMRQIFESTRVDLVRSRKWAKIAGQIARS